MSNTKPYDCAFPTSPKAMLDGECGLSTREYFAICAMQGLLAADLEGAYAASEVADEAVAHADALIKALNNE